MSVRHLSEALRVHGGPRPVEVQHLGPLGVSRLGRACGASSAHQGALASSLGSQSAPRPLLGRAPLQSLAQDTSPKHLACCGDDVLIVL